MVDSQTKGKSDLSNEVQDLKALTLTPQSATEITSLILRIGHLITKLNTLPNKAAQQDIVTLQQLAAMATKAKLELEKTSPDLATEDTATTKSAEIEEGSKDQELEDLIDEMEKEGRFEMPAEGLYKMVFKNEKERDQFVEKAKKKFDNLQLNYAIKHEIRGGAYHVELTHEELPKEFLAKTAQGDIQKNLFKIVGSPLEDLKTHLSIRRLREQVNSAEAAISSASSSISDLVGSVAQQAPAAFEYLKEQFAPNSSVTKPSSKSFFAVLKELKGTAFAIIDHLSETPSGTVERPSARSLFDLAKTFAPLAFDYFTGKSEKNSETTTATPSLSASIQGAIKQFSATFKQSETPAVPANETTPATSWRERITTTKPAQQIQQR